MQYKMFINHEQERTACLKLSSGKTNNEKAIIKRLKDVTED
jgi:hypothetical protein